MINITNNNLVAELERMIRNMSKRKTKISRSKMSSIGKVALKWSKRLKRYRDITGKKRISKEEKEMLSFFTPKSVAGKVKVESKTYKSRVTRFKNIYGKKSLTKEAMRRLQYAGAKSVGKSLNLEEEGWYVFSDVKLPTVRWEHIPKTIREWKRGFSGSMRERDNYFLYRNLGLIILADPTIDLNRVADEGADGNDYSLHDFFALTIPKVARKVLFDPASSGEIFFCKKR